MKSLLIIYHSQSGSSARLAQAAWNGAKTEEGVTVAVKRAWDAGVHDLARADGVLFVLAENSGYMAGDMKGFLDRIFYPAIARGLVLPYALMVSAGNDGRSAVRQAKTILSGIPFKAASEPMIFRGEVTQAHLDNSKELGQALAVGLEMGIF